MKKTLFISLLLTTFALAAEPATPVKETSTTKTTTVAPAAKTATPAPASKPVAVDSTKQAEAAPVTDTTTVDTTANAEATPATETATVDSTAKATPAIETAAIDTAAKATTQKKKKAKKVKKIKAKKAPLITAGAFKFDMNSDFEIQAGKVLWASEKDTSKNNFEEWTGRANLSFFTQSENFDGKVALSVYPGDLIDNKTDENYTSKTEVIDVIELREAWAWQRTKYFNFKLGDRKSVV